LLQGPQARHQLFIHLIHPCDLCLDLARRQTEAISVPVEQNTFVLTLSTVHRLDPLTCSKAGPHALEEAQCTTLGVAAIMFAHDWLDGLGGLIGMVEWDRADVVMQDVGLDNAVEQLTANEAEFPVDGCCGATGVGPGGGGVVRKRWVGVLEESDHD
jgi:hypothetical protein